MGVRITDSETVALYDSTTATAFGPLFSSEDEAQEFLDWLKEKAEKNNIFTYDGKDAIFESDPRTYTDGELEQVFHLWQTHNDV